MKKRIKSISPLQLGIVLAVFYAALALLLVIPFMLFMSLASASMPAMHTIANGSGPAVNLPTPATFSAGLGIFAIILAPCIYGVMGFIFGIISAVIYNLIAKITGGLEFTVVDVPQ